MKNKEILKKRIYSFSMAFALTMSLFPQASIPVQAQEVTEEKSEEKGFFEKISDGFSNLFNTSNNNIDTYAAGDVVQTVSPTGTEINVFDYQQFDDDPLSTAYAIDNIDNGRHGINRERDLKFTSGAVGSYGSNNKNINTYAGYQGLGDAGVYKGIVQNKLQNGYPVLASGNRTGEDQWHNPSTNSEQSLDYLFNPDLKNVPGRRAYANVQDLLQIDENNYYVYDSRTHFAELDEKTKKFTVREVSENTDKNGVGYFPFNKLNGNADGVEGSKNFHLGTTMTTRFLQTKDGLRTDGSPITYRFSGDDDVWVFIDGVLVADLGGIHGRTSVEIDFNSGIIKINDENAGTLGQKLGIEDNDTLPDDTLHTLKFFYLERGTGESNMELRFNLVSVPESEIIKTDEQGKPIAGAKLQLSAKDGPVIASGVTDANGSIVLVDDEDRPIYFQDLYNKHHYTEYTLEEIGAPEGYRKIAPMTLHYDEKTGAILADEKTIWQEGAYASGRFRAYIDSKEQDQDPYAFNEDLNGHTSATDYMREGKLERGMFFALPLRYMGNDEDLANGNYWRGVYSQGNDYFVSKNVGMDGIVEAAQNGGATKFSLNTNGQYQVDIEKLPGLLDEYYFYLKEAGKKPSNTKWSTGFYYTTANDFNGITSGNTIRLANSNDFTRQFAAVFNVPNIKNELYVRKVDDAKVDETGNSIAGNRINDTEFTLYKVNEETFEGEISADEIRDGDIGEKHGSMKTGNLSIPTLEGRDPVEKPGVAKYPSQEGDKPLVNGYYFLVETDVPKGYSLSDSVVQVFVDDTGVYANATAKGYDKNTDDGITVDKGVGYLVDTMSQFAYSVKDIDNTKSQFIDTTLHNIIADMQSSETGYEGWSSVGNKHLQYGSEGAVMNYGPSDPNDETPYLYAEDGWSKMVINQCDRHTIDGSYSKDLEDKNITGLFSGYTIVEFTDTRVADLDISKVVEGYQGATGLDTIQKNAVFTFDINLDLSAVEESFTNDEFDLLDSDSKPILDDQGEPIKIKDGKNIITLKHGENAIIKGLPFNAKYTITETGIKEGSTEVSFDKFKTTSSTNNEQKNEEGTNNEEKGFDLFGWLFNNKEEAKDVKEESNQDNRIVVGTIQDPNPDTSNIEPITVEYTNTYYATGTSIATVSFNAKKEFDGWTNMEHPSDAGFIFQLIAVDGAPMPENSLEQEGYQYIESNVIKNADDVADFGAIEYSVPDTYEYLIQEKIPEDKAPGVNYSSEQYKVVVNVTETTDGELTTSTRYYKTRDFNGTQLEPNENETTENIVIKNTYGFDTDVIKIQGQKNVVVQNSDNTTTNINKNIKLDGMFKFNIEAVGENKDTAPMPKDTLVVTGPVGLFMFGGMEFTSADIGKSYVYKITEDTTDKLGYIDYTKASPVFVKVAVTNGKKEGGTKDIVVASQTLVTDETGDTAVDPPNTTPTFTNIYKVSEASATIQGTKILEGRDWNNDSFTFRLTAIDENAKELIGKEYIETTATSKTTEDSEFNFDFDEFKFEELKNRKDGKDVYTFILSEVDPKNDNGIKYDDYKVTVTIQITDNYKGQLQAKVTYDGKETPPVFTNVYSEKGMVSLVGTKNITGRSFKSGDSFTFNVEGEEGSPMPKGVDKNGNITINPTRGNSAEIQFGDIEFTKPGTYVYTLKEVDPSKDESDQTKPLGGVKYDSSIYEITYTVSGNNSGELSVLSKVEKNEQLYSSDLIWENVYNSEGSIDIKGTKTLSGRDWKESDQFTFVLEPNLKHEATKKAYEEGKIILPSGNVTVKNEDLKGDVEAFNFKPIKFKNVETLPGQSYEFIVREQNGGTIKDGVAFDENQYTVRVKVVDNQDGTLTTSRSDTIGDLQFTNVYSEKGSDALVGTKNITGRSFKSGDSFTFNVVGKEGAPMPDGVDENGNITITPTDGNSTEIQFGDIEFTKPGTYVYTLKEVDPSKDKSDQTKPLGGVTYDSSIYEITYTVSGDNSGKLSVSSTVKKDGQSYSGGLIWTNEYNSNGSSEGIFKLDGSKKLVGREWSEQDSFTFVLTGGDENTNQKIKDGNIVLPGTEQSQDKTKTEASVTKDDLKDGVASFSFGDILFNDVTADAEHPFVFKIYEKLPEGVDVNNPVKNGISYDTHERIIKLAVSDENQEGKLTVSEVTTQGDKLFANTYSPADTLVEIKGTKRVVGHDTLLPTDQFTFTLKAVSEAAKEKTPTEIVVSNNDAQGNTTSTVSFGPLNFSSSDIGKDFKYEITESGSVSGIKNDVTPVQVTITVTDDPTTGKVAVTVDYNGKSDDSGFVFINHALTPAQFTLDGSKTVIDGENGETYQMVGNEFSFKVTPQDANNEFDPIAEVYTVSNDNAGNIVLFDNVSYTNIGTYSYTVEEVVNKTGLFEFDTTKYNVKVVVDTKTDKPEELEVKSKTITKEDGTPVESIEFNNKYTPAVATIAGKKNLTGKDIGEMDEQFEFTVEPVSGVPLEETPEEPEQPELPQTEEQIPVEQPSGDTIPEQPPVVENSQDEETSEEQPPVEIPEEQPVMFNGDILGLIKPIFAEDKLPTGTLEIPAVQNNTAYNDKTGAFSFGKVLFTQPGKFTYRVKETKGTIPGITYDGTSYIVEFTVEEKDGKLIVTNTTYLNETNGTAANGIVFNNSYAVLPTAINISGIKSIEGKELKADEFTFLLQNQSGNTIAEAKNNAEGGFVFENIPFDAVGEYNYSVVEKNTGNKGVTYDESKYGVHVEVIDKNAQLKATPTITLNGKDVNEITFKNTYKAVQKGTVRIGGQKVLKNRQLVKDEFTFVLKDETGKEISRVTNDEIGAFLFDEIVYDRAGDYTYTVSEIKGSDKTVTYDESVHKVVVSVVDDGLGNLVPEIKYTDDIPVFVNVAEKDSQPPVDPKPEKPADPEKPSGGKDNANTATQTYAGMFVSMMTSAASLAGILAILKKRREI